MGPIQANLLRSAASQRLGQKNNLHGQPFRWTERAESAARN
jgi:hypothetical protein